MKNLLEFFPSCKAKSPTEFCGPCPSCGGRDRFLIWPQRGETGRYHCRQCGIGGDAIDFLRTFEGMSYVDACKSLGVAPKDKRAFHEATASQVKPTRQKEAQAELPPKKWSEQAAVVLADCQSEFLRSTEAVTAICGQRYIGEQAAIKSCLGWHSRDEYFSREAWGLPPLQGREKILIPRGLVIATRRKSGVVGLTVRCTDDRPEGRPKYHEIAGSGKAPFVIGKVDVPVILMESALDAILAWQEGEGRVACVATMGSSKPFDDQTRAFIERAPKVICCPDNDQGGNKAWERWRSQFPKSVNIAPVDAKDLGDMHSLAILQTMRGEQRTAPFVGEWLRIALKIA